jgi:hypothetical protein
LNPEFFGKMLQAYLPKNSEKILGNASKDNFLKKGNSDTRVFLLMDQNSQGKTTRMAAENFLEGLFDLSEGSITQHFVSSYSKAELDEKYALQEVVMEYFSSVDSPDERGLAEAIKNHKLLKIRWNNARVEVGKYTFRPYSILQKSGFLEGDDPFGQLDAKLRKEIANYLKDPEVKKSLILALGDSFTEIDGDFAARNTAEICREKVLGILDIAINKKSVFGPFIVKKIQQEAANITNKGEFNRLDGRLQSFFNTSKERKISETEARELLRRVKGKLKGTDVEIGRILTAGSLGVVFLTKKKSKGDSSKIVKWITPEIIQSLERDIFSYKNMASQARVDARQAEARGEFTQAEEYYKTAKEYDSFVLEMNGFLAETDLSDESRNSHILSDSYDLPVPITLRSQGGKEVKRKGEIKMATASSSFGEQGVKKSFNVQEIAAGNSLKDWLAPDLDPPLTGAQRKQLKNALTELMDLHMKNILSGAPFHGDLHAGNIFIDLAGAGDAVFPKTITLIDGGTVGQLDELQRQGFADIFKNVMELDEDTILKLVEHARSNNHPDIDGLYQKLKTSMGYLSDARLVKDNFSINGFSADDFGDFLRVFQGKPLPSAVVAMNLGLSADVVESLKAIATAQSVVAETSQGLRQALERGSLGEDLAAFEQKWKISIDKPKEMFSKYFAHLAGQATPMDVYLESDFKKRMLFPGRIQSFPASVAKYRGVLAEKRQRVLDLRREISELSGSDKAKKEAELAVLERSVERYAESLDELEGIVKSGHEGVAADKVAYAAFYQKKKKKADAAVADLKGLSAALERARASGDGVLDAENALKAKREEIEKLATILEADDKVSIGHNMALQELEGQLAAAKEVSAGMAEAQAGKVVLQEDLDKAQLEVESLRKQVAEQAVAQAAAESRIASLQDQAAAQAAASDESRAASAAEPDIEPPDVLFSEEYRSLQAKLSAAETQLAQSQAQSTSTQAARIAALEEKASQIERQQLEFEVEKAAFLKAKTGALEDVRRLTGESSALKAELAEARASGGNKSRITALEKELAQKQIDRANLLSEHSTKLGVLRQQNTADLAEQERAFNLERMKKNRVNADQYRQIQQLTAKINQGISSDVENAHLKAQLNKVKGELEFNKIQADTLRMDQKKAADLLKGPGVSSWKQKRSSGYGGMLMMGGAALGASMGVVLGVSYGARETENADN